MTKVVRRAAMALAVASIPCLLLAHACSAESEYRRGLSCFGEVGLAGHFPDRIPENAIDVYVDYFGGFGTFGLYLRYRVGRSEVEQTLGRYRVDAIARFYRGEWHLRDGSVYSGLSGAPVGLGREADGDGRNVPDSVEGIILKSNLLEDREPGVGSARACGIAGDIETGELLYWALKQ